VKAECPLCKTAFKLIIHTIKKDDEYEEYKVPSPQPIQDIFGDGFLRGAGSWFLDDIIQFREQFSRSIASLSLPSLRPMPDHRFRMSVESHRPRRRGGLATSEFRADIYDRRLRVEPDSIVDAITGRARECTPAWYRDNPAQTHRLVPWLNRELNALLATQPQRTMYVSQLIMEEVLRSDIQSQAFHDRLLPYLGGRTRHFQHEFFHFARRLVIGY
jgi:E3 ubiquitin-protein ligase Topors